MTNLKLSVGALLVSLSMIAAPAVANPAFESGDAGYLPGADQTVAAGTTTISGLAGGGGTSADVDLFRFGWGGGSLTIDTAGSSFDTILYLFDSNGLGLFGNDDAIGLQSSITAILSAGDYLVGISSCCSQPTSAGGAIFPQVFVGGLELPTGPGGGSPLSGWTDLGGTPFTPQAGQSSYVINFSGRTAAVDVPAPAPLALIGLGLLAIAGRRRKNA